MRQALMLPVWVMVLAMWMAPRPAVIETPFLLRYVAMLEELRQALPVPRTWWQRTVVRLLIEWIDREAEAGLMVVRMKAILIRFES